VEIRGSSVECVSFLRGVFASEDTKNEERRTSFGERLHQTVLRIIKDSRSDTSKKGTGKGHVANLVRGNGCWVLGVNGGGRSLKRTKSGLR